MFQGEGGDVQPAARCSIGSGDFRNKTSLHFLLNLILEESSLIYVCGLTSSLVAKDLDSGGSFFLIRTLC